MGLRSDHRRRTSHEAFEIAATSPASGWTPIIADQRLGEGLTGIETAQEIARRSGRTIPTLVLTGETGENEISVLGDSGFGVLHKPVAAEVSAQDCRDAETISAPMGGDNKGLQKVLELLPPCLFDWTLARPSSRSIP